ncbi:MAG: phosphotransferase [candidate division Zixibacteria bacterium]|nr:phosphotransferase [candidate division Zixibacteria bacterium]
MLKPSPAYSHLAAATDEAVMPPIFQAPLSRLWGRTVEIANFHIPRVIPKGEGKFLIQYRFSTVDEHGHQPRIFFGRLLSPSEMIPAYAKEPNAFFVANIRLVVPVFPFDPKIKTLAQFFDPAPGPGLLQPLTQTLGLNGTAQVVKVDVLGYRLERRGILNISVSEHGRTLSLVAKLVRSEKAAGLFEQLRTLEENGFGASSKENIRVPHPVTATSEGVLWLEAIADSSLHDLIETERFIPGCRSAGLALQKLHSAKLQNLSLYTIEEALSELKDLAFETARIYPALQENVHEVWKKLESSRPAMEEKEFAPLHRDFYDKQLLAGSNRTTLLDTDALSRGDPAQDVGNFLAHLILRGKQHSLPEKIVGQARTNFLEAYHPSKSPMTGKNFQKRTTWWEAASLLRLACLYSLRPRWKKLAIPLLEQSKKTPRGESNA